MPPTQASSSNGLTFDLQCASAHLVESGGYRKDKQVFKYWFFVVSEVSVNRLDSSAQYGLRKVLRLSKFVGEG